MARVARSAVLGRVVSLCVGVTLVAGCMALPKLETAVFQDPLLEHVGTVPLKAGMMTLKDARPPEERGGTRGHRRLRRARHGRHARPT